MIYRQFRPSRTFLRGKSLSANSFEHHFSRNIDGHQKLNYKRNRKQAATTASTIKEKKTIGRPHRRNKTQKLQQNGPDSSKHLGAIMYCCSGHTGATNNIFWLGYKSQEATYTVSRARYSADGFLTGFCILTKESGQWDIMGLLPWQWHSLMELPEAR